MCVWEGGRVEVGGVQLNLPSLKKPKHHAIVQFIKRCPSKCPTNFNALDSWPRPQIILEPVR